MSSQSKENMVFYGIIGGNVCVYLAWLAAEKDYNMRSFLFRHFTLSTNGFYYQSNYHTLLTSVFSHKDLLHIGMNMLVFYSFGRNVLSILGAARFLQLYIGGGVISSFCQLHWRDHIPRNWPAYYRYNRNSVAMGASGAVNAMLAWHILTFPWARIYLYGLLPVPSALVGAGLVGMDAWNMYDGGTSIGNAGHLGGVAFGTAYYFLSKQVLRRIR